MIDDFDNRRERDFYNLAVSPLDFNSRDGQRLGSFHAAHDAADAVTITRHDFNIALAVQWLKS